MCVCAPPPGVAGNVAGRPETHSQVIGELPLQVALVSLELEDVLLQLGVVPLQGLELVYAKRVQITTWVMPHWSQG